MHAYWSHICGLVRHHDGHDHSVETESCCENFDDEHFHESSFGLGVHDGSRRADDSCGQPASQVAESRHEASGEKLVALPLGLMEHGISDDVDIEAWLLDFHVVLPALGFGLQENGDDHTVDGNGLTENDRNQIDGSDSRSLD